MIQSLLKIDRKFRINYNNLCNAESSDKEVIQISENFADHYCLFNSINSTELKNLYDDFLIQYAEDLDSFKHNGKYPVELNIKRKVNREQYDLALILSTLVSPVRHSIMKEIKDLSKSLFGKVAIIGIGAGLDLKIIQTYAPHDLQIEAYDITLDEFVVKHFENTNLHEKEFVEQTNRFDSIIAIELLEHIKTPYEFIQMCKNSLKKEGRFIFTTATDMPQFDHLYNFNDDTSFLNHLNNVGLEIVKKVDYFHNYMSGPSTSKNTWYECKV